MGRLGGFQKKKTPETPPRIFERISTASPEGTSGETSVRTCGGTPEESSESICARSS